MRLAAWCTMALITAGSTLAAGQTTPTPAAPPAKPAPEAPPATPAPAAVPAVPADPSEAREIEIVEPSKGDGPRETSEVRKVRVIVEKDGDAFWVDDGGETHELGDAMDHALQFNPEIRAIRAEIQALLARLDQLERKTATDVARKRVEIRQLRDKREKDKDLVEKKAKSPEDLADLDSEIASREIEMKYLLGADLSAKPGAPASDEARYMKFLGRDDMKAFEPIALGQREARPGLETAPEKIRKILDSPIDLSFEGKMLFEVMEMIGKQYEVNFSVDVSARGYLISVNVKGVTLRQALSAIADASGAVAFIVRDYGIFVTSRDRAVTVPGPSIPEGVPYLGGGAGRPYRFGNADAPHIERREFKKETSQPKP